ncbi:MAG: TrkH family potassium uptake protein [Lachnospiraceae bacterium]|nr:TrkH family potassium uptake protein [Lachnospiraceae bacterium]
MNYSIIRYIIGWVLVLEAIFLLLPSLVALIYQEKSGVAFIVTAVLCAVIGILLTARKPKNKNYYAREGFVIVALSWIVMSLFGALPFVISGEIPSYVNALFEIVSGFTTTGASILSDVEALSHACLFWRSFSHWIGGMGVFVFLLIVLPLTGGSNMHLMRAESPGPSVGKLVPKVRETAKILYMIYIAMTLIEMVILALGGMSIFEAVTLSFGTAGTGGFGVKNSSIADYSVFCQAVITIFMILFGVNFNFYYYLLGKNKKNAFKIEEVKWYFIIIFASIAVITFNIREFYDSIWAALHHAAFQVGSVITTTGYATADFNLWPQMSKTVLVLIMFCGACAGSTGGGIKVSRILIMFKTIGQEIKTLIHPRSVHTIKMDDKAVDKGVVRGVGAFLMTYAVIFCVSLLLITLDGKDLITNFTAVTATINNIGPGLMEVGPTGNFAGFSAFSKCIFIFDMLAGRLELYPILLLLTPSVWRKN